jgi:hypothetical protein
VGGCAVREEVGAGQAELGGSSERLRQKVRARRNDVAELVRLLTSSGLAGWLGHLGRALG